MQDNQDQKQNEAACKAPKDETVTLHEETGGEERIKEKTQESEQIKKTEIPLTQENQEESQKEEKTEERVKTERTAKKEKKGFFLWLSLACLLASVSALVVLCIVIGPILSGESELNPAQPSITPFNIANLLPTSTPQPTGHPIQSVPPLGSRKLPVIGKEEPIADIAKALTPSVVSITIYLEKVQLTGVEYIPAGFGSGVILTPDGYIVTNAHVISQYNKIEVTVEGKDTYEARVVGYDSIYDIAVLHIDAQNLTPAPFGDSDRLRTGQTVLAIGDPNGFTGSVTMGIVSAAKREMILSSRRITMIQTDAAINPGNSGGALVNKKGEVVGINSGKTSGITLSGATLEGLGFAIPSNTALDIISQLIACGQIKRAGLGITGSNSPVKDIPGAYIESVTPKGAASKGGLKPRDIIVKVGEEEVTSFADLSEILFAHKAGDTLDITVNRNNLTLVCTVTLEEIALS